MTLFARQTKPPPDAACARLHAARLGLPLDGLTLDKVRKAFGDAIKLAHPDTGGEAKNAALRILEAANAKAVLCAWIESLPDDECPSCHGAGYVRSGSFGVKPCPSCGAK